MRIKQVCKETGLTDKAVRLYINNELIHPSYQENYNGRKNYDFNSKDVELLKKIALLRRYDFSISAIKDMIDNEDCIAEILQNHLINTKQSINQSSMVLTNLNNAYDKSVTSMDDLCDVLQQNLQPYDLDISKTAKNIWQIIKCKIPLMIIICIVGIVLALGLFSGIVALLVNFFLSLQ